MRVTHLSDALSLVQQLRQSIFDKHRFRGFSGQVRAVSGTAALITAAVMSLDRFPDTNVAHIIGWGSVFLFASLLNLGAVAYWFLRDESIARDSRALRPALDVIPPLLVGAVLTFALMLNRQPEYLCGVWMCMFGLTNLAMRYVLPGLIAFVGLFYIACGITCLLLPSITFTNPWPMGSVFFIGEWASGLILYADRRRYAAMTRLMEDWEKEGTEGEDENESI